MGGLSLNADATIQRIILTLPAYNEAAAIGPLLERAAGALDGLGADWRIVVVDDGSADATPAIVKQAAASEPRIELARHGVNRGLGPAIATGLARAVEIDSGDRCLIVGMDADMTHPPETIVEMKRAADAGADIVIASRYQPGSQVIGVSLFRETLSVGARLLFRFALHIPGVRDYTCGFRGLRASLVARAFERYGREGLIRRKGFACTDELLVKLVLLGPTVSEVPFVLRYDQKQGASKIRLGVTILETLKLTAWARRELRKMRRAQTRKPLADTEGSG